MLRLSTGIYAIWSNTPAEVVSLYKLYPTIPFPCVSSQTITFLPDVVSTDTRQIDSTGGNSAGILAERKV
ncbi:MAG: hypothetical protein KAS71_07875 [Bacteroidales bacterium]|nr:hypothetical protein [Bacteroidales bacterium]